MIQDYEYVHIAYPVQDIPQTDHFVTEVATQNLSPIE